MSDEVFRTLTLEGLMPLAAAARQLNVHPSSLSRWCQRGAKTKEGQRIRLEHLRMPGRIVTSQAAVARFLMRLDGEPETKGAALRTPAQRTRASREAGEILREMGI